MMNSAWLVWLLCAVSGASIAHLVHADTLMQPLRDRWGVHWLARTDAELVLADSALQIARGASDAETIGKLRDEINKRADAEPGVSFWAHGEARRRARPWSTVRDRLERYAVYAEFISCRWCLPVWVFLFAVVWTWGRVYGFAGEVFAPVAIPLDFALLSLVLGLRWIYAMIDLQLGQDH